VRHLPENPAPTFDVSPLDEKNDQQAADIVCERMQIGHREAARCDAAMTVSELIIKRAPLGPNLEDYSVLEHGAVVGRIFLSPAAPQDRPWMWTSGHNGDIRPAAHGYEPTHEAAMAAFAKSWKR
jgi:hypothetical protein